MGMQSSLIRFKRKTAVTGTGAGIFPYFGAAALVSNTNKTGAFILALPQRGPTASRVHPSAQMNSANMQTTMYYAYPTSYGQAVFTDLGTGFQGGWDGAFGDSGNTLGPRIVNVTIDGISIPFYLYQTDYPNNGLMYWKVD